MKARELANYLLALEKTTSRLRITEILAEILRKAEVEETDKLCYLLLGELAPPYRGIVFNLAEKMMMRILSEAFGVSVEEVKGSFGKKGDLGLVAEELAQRKEEEMVSSLTVKELYDRFLEIAWESGQGSQERKIKKMVALLKMLSPAEARFFTRIPLGRLRLGFSETTLLDALSWLLSGDKRWREEIEAAYNRRADIGFIAKEVKKKGIEGLREIRIVLGTPVLPSLCQRLPTAEEMIKKMASGKGDLVAVEPKYDGTRLEVQFQREEGKIWMFTRNLENVVAMFPDIAEAMPKEVNAQSAILDGEVIGVDKKTGRLLPFQETIKRKRKHAVQEALLRIPLRYYCFDVLYYNGEEVINLPFSKRRQILEKIVKADGEVISLSPQILTNNVEELRRYHDEQIKKGLEGVVVKKWQAPYEPGKRGFTWVKFKQEETKKSGGLLDTVEGVVMGYYQGRGKRAGFGIGAFLVGVRKGEKIVTVSKIGTGLSDDDWREMRRRAQAVKTTAKPKEYEVPKELAPDVWCLPKIVVEIAADNLTRSPLHTAGFALRFPRLVRFRDDKSIEEITTLEELKKLG
ncbi:ATP-dependent DNA ligase [Candidatus Shapirobacteria bacterium]|nr:ATP-dependent DNA ligase [Candidatus Shapirobacteria bacterium]